MTGDGMHMIQSKDRIGWGIRMQFHICVKKHQLRYMN